MTLFCIYYQTIKLLSLIQEYPPIGGKKRRLPAAPTPYRKISDDLTMENTSDDEKPGPSTSALKVSHNELGIQ